MPGFSTAEIPAMTGSVDFLMGTLGNRLIAQDANGGALPVLYAAVAAVPAAASPGPAASSGSAARRRSSRRRPPRGTAKPRAACGPSPSS
jgi:hypothetical protein